MPKSTRHDPALAKYTISCVACGENFLKNSKRASRCKACISAQVYRCAECNTEFSNHSKGKGGRTKTCSLACRDARQTRLRLLKAEQYPGCTVAECEKRVRSSGAALCEMHYGRKRLTGKLTKKRRDPTGACHHCGDAAPPKSLFCSAACRKRDRLKIPGRHNICVSCRGEIDHNTRRNDAIACSDACMRTWEKAKSYEITAPELHDLLEATTACPICGATDREMVIDHDHESGMVRGLICGQCNAGLGMFQDSGTVLLAAARYLEVADAKLARLNTQAIAAA